jgi:putative endonuclease
MAYYVYLLASKKHGTLYLGVTNDLVRRVYEHRTKAVPGFTTRYGIGKLSGSKSMTRLKRLSPAKKN